MMPSAHRTVDARGFLCPVPTVKTSLALEDLSAGQVLELLADDPVTRRDLPAWCRETGQTLLSIADDGAAFRVYIRKGPRP